MEERVGSENRVERFRHTHGTGQKAASDYLKPTRIQPRDGFVHCLGGSPASCGLCQTDDSGRFGQAGFPSRVINESRHTQATQLDAATVSHMRGGEWTGHRHHHGPSGMRPETQSYRAGGSFARCGFPWCGHRRGNLPEIAAAQWVISRPSRQRLRARGDMAHLPGPETRAPRVTITLRA